MLCVIEGRHSRLAMAIGRALSPGHPRFLGVPFMRPALRVSGLPAAAGDLALLVTIHRSKSAVLFSHARIVRMTNSWGRTNRRELHGICVAVLTYLVPASVRLVADIESRAAMERDWKKWCVVGGAVIATCVLMGLFWLLIFRGLIRAVFSHF